jgi:signal transduction histidine kinase
MSIREVSSSVEELQTLPIFSGLPVDLLQWLLQIGHVLEADEGDVFMEPGQAADVMFVVLSGALRLRVSMPGQPVAVFVEEKGDATGYLPYSRMTKFPARSTAMGLVRVLRIERTHFDEMLARSPLLGQRLVGVMSDRIRTAEKTTQQREKLTALGKLAAGLAHELNNPAAAIMRASDALRARLDTLTPLAGKLVSCGLTTAHIDAAEALRALAKSRIGTVHFTPLERGQCEEEVGEWLEEHGVPQPWIVAETYVDVGLCRADLDQWAAPLPSGSVAHVLAWVEASLATDRMLNEIGDAGSRISELVAAVKAYSHMDRGVDKQPTDVRQGLDSTLRMLGHELKKRKVNVERQYAADLPPVTAYPGELNQVWTNLIDNAIDAAPEGGRIRIEAAHEDSLVTVRIIDNGRGIAPEIQPRIFEPFFTTKPVGEGTGLGLDIVQRIVSQQHGGQVAVASKPGETVFTVNLPL